MTFSLYGIDVSHYQSAAAPGGVPWSLLKSSGVSFAMVRATFGTYRDQSTVAHVKAARACGIQVGLYHFFRHGQPVTDQLAAFHAQAFACGIKGGDICPALDLEDEPGAPLLGPDWNTAAEALSAGLVASFGEAMVYVTQRDFGRLGKPSWVLERPLWVAHYTGAVRPATPADKPWRIWQHRVGPFVPDGPGGIYAANGRPSNAANGPPGPLDQNRACAPLPVCTRVPGASQSSPPPANPSDIPPAAPKTWQQRLDALTINAFAELDLSHDKPDTEPAPPPEAE